jgi:hypothetical protein
MSQESTSEIKKTKLKSITSKLSPLIVKDLDVLKTLTEPLAPKAQSVSIFKF